MDPAEIIRTEIARLEGAPVNTQHGIVLREGKIAGLTFALGALGEPDPFKGLTGADAGGADPSHAFVANGGHR